MIQLNGYTFANNLLYSNDGKIPILRIKDNNIYIVLSDRYLQIILDIVRHIQSEYMNIIFVRKDNLLTWKLDDYSYHYENLSNYLENWVNPLFYYGFEKIGFDFRLSISNYIRYYDCMDVFNDVYSKVGDKLLGKKWINSTQPYKKMDVISDEIIKNSLYSLLIDLKIKEIFDE